MFDIYEHEFTIDGSKYRLVPVSGEHIGLLYKVLSKLQGEDVKISDLDDATMLAFKKLALETFKVSYPLENADKLDKFVSQNLLRLFEPVLKVNLRTPDVVK